MAIDATEFHQFLTSHAERTEQTAPKLEDVQAELDKHDHEAIKADHRGRMTTEVWDGVSNIGDATPEYLRNRDPWMDKAYIIRIDGQITYFQSHVPHVEGLEPITDANADQHSNDHADWLADNRATGEVAQKVTQALGLSLDG